MNSIKLNKILKFHKKWLDGKDAEIKADLSGVDLTGKALMFWKKYKKLILS